MRFQVALFGFDADHDRLLRFHLAHARGQPHEFDAIAHGGAGGADIAVVDLDGTEATAALGMLRAAPMAMPRVEVSADGLRGSSAFRLARPDALSGLPRQLHRVVDTGILVPTGSPSIADVASLDPAVRLLATAAHGERLDQPPFRALVIDADAGIRSDVQAGLRRLGVASDAYAEAGHLEPQLRQQHYDLLFIDSRADGGNSYTLCRRLRRHPDLAVPPLIMLCAPSDPFDRARAALCGCTAHLPKPLPWSEFRRLVDAILRPSTRHLGGPAHRRPPHERADAASPRTPD